MNRSLDAIVVRYIGYALLFLGVAYLLYRVRGALPVFVVAGLIAYALEPALQRLERRGHSRRSAVGFVFLSFLTVFIVLLAILASAWQQAQALAANVPDYQQRFTEIVEQNRQRVENLRLPRDVKESIRAAITEFQNKAPQEVARRLTGVVGWTVSSLGTLVIFLVVMPIITLWLMLEMNPLRARLLMLVPPTYRYDVTTIVANINELLGRYVRGQMIICGLFGLLCTIAFSILGVMYDMNYPLVLGIVAAFLYIMPYVGMATIALSAGLTAYFTSSSPVLCAILAVACPICFNLAIDYGIAPRVLGRGVGLHPLLVIFALLAGAQLGGVLGMILAVPVFASLRVIAIHLFPQLAAPIPETPPEVKESREERVASEIVRQTREAEAAAPPSPIERVTVK